MSLPTPDSPQERDAKADALVDKVDSVAASIEKEKVDAAEKLAREVRRFRWEVRTYYLVVALFVIVREL